MSEKNFRTNKKEKIIFQNKHLKHRPRRIINEQRSQKLPNLKALMEKTNIYSCSQVNSQKLQKSPQNCSIFFSCKVKAIFVKIDNLEFSTLFCYMKPVVETGTWRRKRKRSRFGILHFVFKMSFLPS